METEGRVTDKIIQAERNLKVYSMIQVLVANTVELKDFLLIS